MADTDKPFHAELIVRVVNTKPCITLYGGGTCSYQEAAIQLGGIFDRELPYGCLLSKSNVPEGAISTYQAESGNRIAFRCGKKDYWHVIYIGSENSSFKDCKDYPFADNFDWTNVPDFKTSAAEMVGRKCEGASFRELVLEMRQIGGESAVTDLLINTISFNAYRKISMDNLQAWDDVYMNLSASEKSRLIPVFRKAILDESSPVLALERAVRYEDLDIPEYMPAMITRMRRIVNSAPHYETDASAEIILSKIAIADPKVGADLACRELERDMKRGAIVYLSAALLAVAQANYPCPAVLPNLANSRCDANYFCPPGQTSHICESKELKADIEKALADTSNIRKLSIPLKEKALLAAALPLKEAKDILQLWQKRRSYTVDQPLEPECEKQYIIGKKGVPCNCFKTLPNSACGKIYNETTCVYTVDDVAGKIKDVVTP